MTATSEMVPLTATDADGNRYWWTGKAGTAWVSKDSKDAFLSYSLDGARRWAAQFNKTEALHGLRFTAVAGDLREEVEARVQKALRLALTGGVL